MNTYKIVANSLAKYGFDLITIDDSNNVTRKELTSKTTDDYLRMAIPEYNIKMVSLKQINENLDENGEYVLQPKVARKNAKTQTVAKSSWLDYLDENDRKIVNELKAKAEQAMRIKKLKAQIAELEKQLEGAE